MADKFNQEAVEWVDRVNSASGTAAGWRLEILTKRFRKKYKDDDKKIPIRIRRFVRGLPWALVHDAVKYLMSLAPYEGVIYNGVEIEGKYRPTVTRWVRDDQEQVDGRASGSYTLIQDLIEDEVTDDFSAVSGGSCSEEVLTEWHWDEPDVVDITSQPDFGTQGVTYSVQAVHRNEDGTFGYAVVRRVAKTQSSGWRTVECNEFEKTETATWDNVYGGLGGEGLVDDTGESISIPDACGAETGTTVTRQITENQDCTFRVVVQRRTALEKTGTSVTCSTNVFEHTHESVDRAQTNGLSHAPKASGGKSYSYKSDVRPDGRYDNTKRTTTEERSVTASKSRRKTLRGVTEVTTTRGTTDDSTSVSRIGDEVTVERTPGGLWNRTVKSVTSESVGKVASRCQKTVFEHQQSSTSNSTSAGKEHASNAGSGITYETSSRLTEEGTWDVTTSTVTELKSASARVARRKTLRGVVTTVTDRNTNNSNTGVTNIGDEVVVEKTPGGRWNRTKTTIERTPAGNLSHECRRTVFEHRHAKTVNQTGAPEPTEVEAPEDGVIHEKTARRTEEGTWDVVDSKVQELPCPGAVTRKRRTLRSIITTVTDRNVPDQNGTDQNPDGSLIPELSIGGEAQIEKTPGGLWNRTVTQVMTAPVGALAQSNSETVFESNSSETVNSFSSGATNSSAGGGSRTETSSRRQEDGTWDNTTQQINEKQVSNAEVTRKKTVRGTVVTTTDRNTQNSQTTVQDPGDSVTARRTPGGSYDRVETEQEPAKYRKWEVEVSLNHLYIERVWFINAEESDYKNLINSKQSTWKSKLQGWISDKRPYMSASISPEISLTEWDRFDGSVTFTVRWSAASAGQDGEVDKLFFEAWSSVSSAGGGKTFKNLQAVGRGEDKLSEYVEKEPDANSGGCTDSFSYNPETGTWSFSRRQTVINET